MNGIALRGKQRGATLIVGLILLLVLTVLGVSGMNTSRMEVRMAGNTQFRQDAFQLAESGIDIAITATAANPNTTPTPVTLPDWLGTPYDRKAVTTFDRALPVGDVAFSMGNTAGVAAYHFDVVSESKAPRNATQTHRQSFYILGRDTDGNQP